MLKRTESFDASPPQTRLHDKVAGEPVVSASTKTFRELQKTKPQRRSNRRQPDGDGLQNQKLEAVGLLASDIAHDFKNLLTIVSGNLEMLALDRNGPRQQRKLIAEAWRTTDLMGQLTANLLAFVHQGTVECIRTDISLVTASSARLLTRLLGNGFRLETKIDEGLVATINPAHFQTVLVNLVLNARDAMPDGGCVTVRVEEAVVDVEAAREMRLQAGRYIAVSISDTGIGMPTEALYRAFDSFYTTKPAGDGLGLASVQKFAANVGGAARINSKLDCGTAVQLLIPRRAEEAATNGESFPPVN